MPAPSGNAVVGDRIMPNGPEGAGTFALPASAVAGHREGGA